MTAIAITSTAPILPAIAPIAAADKLDTVAGVALLEPRVTVIGFRVVVMEDKMFEVAVETVGEV